MGTVDSMLKDVVALPSLPTIAIRIIQEIKKDKLALRELVEIISYDPALTAKILRVANSSFYALPYKVDSIDRAVNILGIEALKNIALSFVIVRGLKRDSTDGFNHEHFWKRSITAAVSTEMIAQRLGMNREDTFVTPLLMDIGVLVMYQSSPEDYMKVFDLKRASHIKTSEAERSIFGFDHEEAGSETLKRWKLPGNICLPIAYHHRTEESPPEYKDIVEVLAISDMVSSFYNGKKNMEKLAQLKGMLQQKFNAGDEEVEAFIDAIAERTVEILGSFEIDAGNMKPYSQILQEANEELGKLNLSYEQLVVELTRAKKEAEDYAVELWDIKEKMREMAIRDSLTGLYNHRYFQEQLEKEIYRAERYSRSFSLLIIDIDHFKKINDTYGHPQGDVVLRTIGELFAKSVRDSDTPARYGGEEFAIILAEADINGAASLSERLRRKVEQLRIEVGAHRLGITVSIGLTSYDPSRGKRSKSEIIDAADRAMYNSKASGRNKLSIII